MATEYFPIIGLEIHAELLTQTKMFCNSRNDVREERPNVNVCPVCMGHPGSLPTINMQAVRHVVTVGVSVGGTIADYTEFDRKNYFYPDIPKGYQISQYEFPLVTGGRLADVALTRVHLEEDTAQSLHPEGDGTHSLVDFNRAGVPLMELVTEPVITSASHAMLFAKELQLLLRTLGVSRADMERGEMRVEANISVSPEKGKFGTKVEVKNLNSFRAVGKAIEYEIARHIKALERGEHITQETRGWDEQKGQTFSQRKKESSHDYRYFPDPDIPKLSLRKVSDFDIEVIRANLPELPWERRARYVSAFRLKEEEARFFTENFELGSFFESVATLLSKESDVRIAANYILSDLVGIGIDSTQHQVVPPAFAELVRMISGGEISSRGAKDILRVMYSEGGSPGDIARARGLYQESNEDVLKQVVNVVLDKHATVYREYKEGKIAALQFLIGQVMRESKGSGNPGVIKKLIEER